MIPKQNHAPVLAALGVLFIGMSGASSVSAQVDTNLLTNGGAESGETGWTTTAGNLGTATYASGGWQAIPGPADRGSYFFHGGFSTAFTSAVQSIDVSSMFSAFATGSIGYTLSGYLGGYLHHNDQPALFARFLSGSGTELGVASIGPVSNLDRGNQTSLLFRSATGGVPAGTETILAELRITRFSGSNNDGWADNLSLSLQSQSTGPGTVTPEPVSLLLLGSGLAGVGAIRRRTGPGRTARLALD